ncbi:ribose-5-phosphate isomerase A [Amylibacter marinus]|uniref:Ribose-5-phosphate isomerase A n=1 Tax=Amylibacter marinus TaxID=1475483 RepID=A0ABQ5VTJ7_9RHOB|nr:ribose-5-phosphate isomerase RpiA [Amylibacter marinus]GLQ34600.1 ribose-5-phosphate isomerase A [Amylibacter marinus]
MIDTLPPAEIGKFISAKHAMQEVRAGMKLGLGTGSTAAWLVKLLAHAQNNHGLMFQACATSTQTTNLATSLGIEIQSLDALGALDLAIDGADEFDPNLDLIKGGGGALLQEKIVESNAKRLVIITDASKQVDHLGAFPLPIEVTKFGWISTQRQVEEALKSLGLAVRTTWRGGPTQPFVTDEGNHILDIYAEKIIAPRALSDAMLNIPGVVETGLFIDMASTIIMGDADGTARFREGTGGWSEKSYDLAAEADLIAALLEMDA